MRAVINVQMAPKQQLSLPWVGNDAVKANVAQHAHAATQPSSNLQGKNERQGKEKKRIIKKSTGI